MHLENIIDVLSFIGIFVFAISGFATAANKKLDLFGGIIISMVTALGGGTLRDLLLNEPVNWLANPVGMYLAIVGGLSAMLFKRHMIKLRKTLFLFDTIGISLFTISGIQLAQSQGYNSFVLIIIGVISATFGGVIRDILCNEIPLIFRKEIYATACILGAMIYLVLDYYEFNLVLKTVIACASIISIRTLAVVKGYRFPILNSDINK